MLLYLFVLFLQLLHHLLLFLLDKLVNLKVDVDTQSPDLVDKLLLFLFLVHHLVLEQKLSFELSINLLFHLLLLPMLKYLCL